MAEFSSLESHLDLGMVQEWGRGWVPLWEAEWKVELEVMKEAT